MPLLMLINRWFKVAIALVMALWITLPLAIAPPALALNLMPQLALAATPPALTLTNRFQVTADQVNPFLERWDTIGQYMKQQPGFISAELKKDLLSSSTWVMTEEWTSLSAYQQAVSQPEFQALVADFPAQANWFAPDLFPSHEG